MRNILVHFTMFLAGLLWATATARAQLSPPRLGYIKDASAALRPVYGIPAAAFLGDPATDAVNSFACAAKLCLAKTDTALVPFSTSDPASAIRTEAPAGAAVIAVADGTTDGAWIYFDGTKQYAHWQAGTWSGIDYSPGGAVLSLRATADGFDYAVVRDPSGGKAWIEHFSMADGSVTVLDSVDTTGSVLLLDSGVLYAADGQLILRRADGTQLSFAIADVAALYAAGKGYVEIEAAGGLWILTTVPGFEQLAMLPGTPTWGAQ